MESKQKKQRVTQKKIKQALADSEELIRYRYGIVNAKATERRIKDMMQLVKEDVYGMTPEQFEAYSTAVQKALSNPDHLAAAWSYCEMEDHYEEL